MAGLAALAEELRHGGLVNVRVALDPEARPALSREAGTDVLQLVREALSNAARHGRAQRIALELRQTSEGSVVEIDDDGIGFEPDVERATTHRGLRNMRTRAVAVGGTLQIRSAPGTGTRITLTLPGEQREGP